MKNKNKIIGVALNSAKKGEPLEVLLLPEGKTAHGVQQALKDVIWMARRYADGRQTYAPSMFNDAYDTLRSTFGDEIDPDNIKDDLKGWMKDISLPNSHIHPYAFYGDDPNSQSNQELKRRKYYKKQNE